ncbi:site-specific DNA-methyltransferase [Halorubrum distributum]|uniref:DNA methylase N-4/N-6 domain-containing protein n=1 Tax=Halorubrum distributum JCM 13916 TaxID=1230455 RepID=M0PJU8_9EURY|nr:site-specific DNA-methyltransferase [Halorubrum arcis]EMA70307.1 DNA methylase N-4/N-6 domain-containing protein [Halorubrum arcis JCM 13916]
MSTQTTGDGNREQLQELLRDLFQFDAADLDFGVYRILNQRRDRIEQFIEEDLLDAVDESLESLADAKRTEIEEELEEKAAELQKGWEDNIFNPDGSLKDQYANLGQKDLEEYQDLWETREQVAVAEETEARIFNDLYRFFSRYYEDGDFHTKRRISSKDSKYYVPYNGEETYFHWANNDQYYVKTGEHFTDYQFDASEWTVRFRLEEADVPQDNVKGDSRYFVLGRGDPVATDADEQTVTIRFQYRKITEDEAGDYVEAYNEATGDDRSSFAHMTPEMRCDALEGRILTYVEDTDAERILTAEKNEDATSTVLKSHLTRYVSENSMDYFVHKDLQKFLEGELEFFLQNEVLDVREIINSNDGASPPVLRARTVRNIAERIISFLAQIEDFQKRLFEKKKFVVQTDYMVTLDQVPEELYDDILDNEEQLDQWREVYNTKQWNKDLKWQGKFDRTFLNNHPYVMVDTALFDNEFELKLLSTFEDIEGTIDGILVNSENFQALNLLMEKYRNEIDCTYIDPPYNTGGRDFLYKDSYQHSSWLSMMADRIQLSRDFLSDSGLFFSTIDSNEVANLRNLCDSIFASENFLADIAWEKRYTRNNKANLFYSLKDTILTYRSSEDVDMVREPRTEKAAENYRNPDDDPRGPWIDSSYVAPTSKEERPQCVYSIENPHTGEEITHPSNAWKFKPEVHEQHVKQDRLYWGEDGSFKYPRLKNFLSEMDDGMVPTDLWKYEESGTNDEGGNQVKDLFGYEAFDNPKPTKLIRRMIQHTPGQARGGFVLDFFAGSGTTAQAVIEQNQNDSGNRDYLLVEMGEHFDDVLRPRIQKFVFSKNWTTGTPEGREGTSHLVKYHRLESYEDALNNIALSESNGPLQDYLEEEVDHYTSGYMLDFESQDSASLLPEGTFNEPFSHELKIEQNGTSREPTTVDLIETFHYLIGADVRQYWHETHQDRKYVVTECEVNTESGIEKVLTVWRQTEDIDYEEEKDWFDDEFDTESYDRVYVNGESQITQTEPLEITFREKMEESHNVA